MDADLIKCHDTKCSDSFNVHLSAILWCMHPLSIFLRCMYTLYVFYLTTENIWLFRRRVKGGLGKRAGSLRFLYSFTRKTIEHIDKIFTVSWVMFFILQERDLVLQIQQEMTFGENIKECLYLYTKVCQELSIR